MAETLMAHKEELKSWLTRANLRQTFSLLDVNGDGHVSRDELQLLVGTGTLTAEACSAMMYMGDTDGDGKISLQEFEALGNTLKEIEKTKEELVGGGGRHRSTGTQAAPKTPPPGADLLVSGAGDTQINGFYKKCRRPEVGYVNSGDSEPDKYYHLEDSTIKLDWREGRTESWSCYGGGGGWATTPSGWYFVAGTSIRYEVITEDLTPGNFGAYGSFTGAGPVPAPKLEWL